MMLKKINALEDRCAELGKYGESVQSEKQSKEVELEELKIKLSAFRKEEAAIVREHQSGVSMVEQPIIAETMERCFERPLHSADTQQEVYSDLEASIISTDSQDSGKDDWNSQKDKLEAKINKLKNTVCQNSSIKQERKTTPIKCDQCESLRLEIDNLKDRQEQLMLEGVTRETKCNNCESIHVEMVQLKEALYDAETQIATLVNKICENCNVLHNENTLLHEQLSGLKSDCENCKLLQMEKTNLESVVHQLEEEKSELLNRSLEEDETSQKQQGDLKSENKKLQKLCKAKDTKCKQLDTALKQLQKTLDTIKEESASQEEQMKKC
ncbi:hypothetical protein KUTeg_007242 [Tegillarca granosa]|uniref:Uncharacterized protein n=1 Tax=Tegillarca granosa TaxID=220873 RepID=A0ABQ9FF12_TEGGR|nr:hypothetical protein KUTeg_007242 [Tegillarca granosa]